MNNSPYPADFIDRMQTKLLEKKTKVEEQLQSFAKTDPKQIDNYNSEFPEYGDKEDENAAEVPVFEGNLHLEETLEQTLEMVNRALKKIENGTYGICEKTGQYISQERLEIMPTATKCAPKELKRDV